MMLQSCYAVFATSLFCILNSVSFHCFLSHVELEKEPFATWDQVPWPFKGRSKATTGYMDGLSNQEKNTLKIVNLPSHIRKPQLISWLKTRKPFIRKPGYIKTVEDAFETVTDTELKHLDWFLGLVKIRASK